MGHTNVNRAGVSETLARDRASRMSDLRYDVRLAIPRDRTAPIAGDLAITFTLATAGEPIALDFAPNATGRLQTAAVNGSLLTPAVEQEHILIPAHALRPGQNSVHLVFTAGDAPLNRREEHVYSVFVPARAREAFPCFDQPNLKARWTLTLEIENDWLAIANADVAARRPAGADSAGRDVVSFVETEPIPTYLFAFAAGQFIEEVAERDGRRLRLYHGGTDRALLALNLDALFDAHADALRWMEAYTSLPYPFSTFDIVLLPAFQFSGMEHPGAIFYNESALLLAPSATQQQRLARAVLVAHETAHMWFGDLVTMTWFDDVWMKEVFANFMAAKIVNPQFPELDHDLRFLHGHYPAAYEVDRTRGPNAIRQPLDNLDDAGSLYGAVIYFKSPIVMRQLELLLGETALRDALREYLVRHRFGNASWPDLLVRLAARTRVDLDRWSRGWIDEAGRPVVRSVLTLDGHTVVGLELRTGPADSRGGDRSQDRGSPDMVRRPQRLDVTLGRGTTVEHVEVWLDGDAEVTEAIGRPAPDYILPNGRGLGYGEFRVDERSRRWLMAHVAEVPDALTRGSAWITLWDAMLVQDVDPGQLLELAIGAVAREDSELNLQRILIYLDRLFWIFRGPQERAECAERLERALRARLNAPGASSVKAALLACLRAVASTAPTIEWLRRLWSGDSQLGGLTLGEADHIVLAQELAVRHDDGEEWVRRQVARTQSRERRDALAFVAPALSSDPVERARFFETISDAANRRREPWVIDGLRWLHHPLRADASLTYLEPGLELLEEVKRTGDIFLPKRWLDATLSGHQSVEAAGVVQAFLESRPSRYPTALRRMVLASADYLFRAVERRV